MPLPPSITKLPTFLAFIERQESQRASPIPDAVVNEPETAATGWLHRECRDSIELHRERMGYHYTREERDLLKALRDVLDVGREWADADMQAGDMAAVSAAAGTAAENNIRMLPPVLARIYKARKQGTLCRSHPPVMGQLTVRFTRGGVSKMPGDATPPPSGT